MTRKSAIIGFTLLCMCTPATIAQPMVTDSTSEQPAALAGAAQPDAVTNPNASWWERQTKEEKLFYTNLLAVSAIGGWGLATWDYGSTTLHTANEGWFGRTTKYGGADKLGHYWTTYTFSDLLAGVYEKWGYPAERANLYAAASAWTVQAMMEIGDTTSESQGFSWEDMAVNTLGALASIVMANYPELDRIIDFRIEYVFDEPVQGIFDDYSNQFYSVVAKLDGFSCLADTFLKYFEIHAGYYTRGYDNDAENKERSLYMGITLNLSNLFRQHGMDTMGTVAEYVQLPYTVPKASYHLD